jgi:aryl-alcohol dehydrogenase-like predicted oxidoreductase
MRFTIALSFFTHKVIDVVLCDLMSLPFFQSKHPRYTGENLEKNKVLYTRLEMLSKKYGCTPAQLALSWVLHQGEDVVAIPGEQDSSNLSRHRGKKLCLRI